MKVPLLQSASVRCPSWFWIAVAIGFAIRIYLVCFTEGTMDVDIWERHARDVVTKGLIGYYHADDSANHPPFISEMASLAVRSADATGIPFRVLFRAPFILFDAANAFLLFLLWPNDRWRYAVTIIYWLSPLAIIYSAYHGNTDCAVAFCLLLCIWLISRGKITTAAVVLGTSLWIKLPAILAVPAFIFAMPGWRNRFTFLSVAGVAASSTYLPALIRDAPVVWRNVFGYHGLRLASGGNEPIWGFRVVLFELMAAPRNWPAFTRTTILFLFSHGSQIGLGLLSIFAWLRRKRTSSAELCATIAGCYVILYAFTDEWAFQYFAWSLPFWFFLRPWASVPLIVLANSYIYSLYWFLCGNPWLLNRWDFFGHQSWPPIVNWLRDWAAFSFIAVALALLATAIRDLAGGKAQATSPSREYPNRR